MGPWKNQSLDLPLFRVVGPAATKGPWAWRPTKIWKSSRQAGTARADHRGGEGPLGLAIPRARWPIVTRGPTRRPRWWSSTERGPATARTFAFFQVRSGGLKAHSLVYSIAVPKTRRLAPAASRLNAGEADDPGAGGVEREGGREEFVNDDCRRDAALESALGPGPPRRGPPGGRFRVATRGPRCPSAEGDWARCEGGAARRDETSQGWFALPM